METKVKTENQHLEIFKLVFKILEIIKKNWLLLLLLPIIAGAAMGYRASKAQQEYTFSANLYSTVVNPQEFASVLRDQCQKKDSIVHWELTKSKRIKAKHGVKFQFQIALSSTSLETLNEANSNLVTILWSNPIFQHLIKSNNFRHIERVSALQSELNYLDRLQSSYKQEIQNGQSSADTYSGYADVVQAKVALEGLLIELKEANVLLEKDPLQGEIEIAIQTKKWYTGIVYGLIMGLALACFILGVKTFVMEFRNAKMALSDGK